MTAGDEAVRRREDERERVARTGTPLLERAAAALGGALLVGACAALAWDAVRDDKDQPPEFRFEVLRVEPSGDRHLVRFRVENVGGTTVEELAVTGRLGAEPPETARIVIDFLASGERREAAFLFDADPAALPLELAAESFSEP